MRGCLLALGVATLVAATSGASGARPAIVDSYPVWSPTGKRIAFLSDRGNPDRFHDIYVMSRDGSGLHRLTKGGPGKGDLTWSPIGKWIAYQARAYIDEVSLDGRRHRRLTGSGGSQPDFSPNGKRIVYADIGTETLIYVMREDGSDNKLVASPEDPDEALLAPTWSPDGRRLAFATGDRGDAPSSGLLISHLAIISADGGPRTNFAMDHSIWSTDWSPDGRKILLVELDYRIAVLDLRTRKIRYLGHKANSFWARWSPSGRKILFSQEGRILVMNSDGSHMRAIVPHRKNRHQTDR